MLEVGPSSEMLSRYIGRLHPLKVDIVKCGAHKCSSILDTTSKEAIGKPAKVQVRRALLHDFFASLNTKTFQGTSESVWKVLLRAFQMSLGRLFYMSAIFRVILRN